MNTFELAYRRAMAEQDNRKFLHRQKITPKKKVEDSNRMHEEQAAIREIFEDDDEASWEDVT